MQKIRRKYKNGELLSQNDLNKISEYYGEAQKIEFGSRN